MITAVDANVLLDELGVAFVATEQLPEPARRGISIERRAETGAAW